MSTAERYAAILAELSAAEVPTTDEERVEALTWLERIKSAAAGAQARVTDAFAVAQREKLIMAGSRTADASRSITAQVALARRDSPSKGSRHVGLAAMLVRECRGSWRSFAAGRPASGAAPSSPGRPRS